MSRIYVPTPACYHHRITTRVRIDDLNYGNHMSNDVYLKYMHEARMQFLGNLGLTEMEIGGCSVIMAGASIRFIAECFYGDELIVEIGAGGFGSKSFDFYYRFTRSDNGAEVCEAITAMVCYDYSSRQTQPVPESFRQLIRQLEG